MIITVTFKCHFSLSEMHVSSAGEQINKMWTIIMITLYNNNYTYDTLQATR